MSALKIEDLTHEELLALINEKGGVPHRQADLISLKHRSASARARELDEKLLLASATYSGALDALIDRRPGPHGARKGLQLLQAEVTAKEAYDRARRAAEKARAEEDRLWAAWCVETGL